MTSTVFIKELNEDCNYSEYALIEQAVYDILGRFFRETYGATIKNSIPSGSTIVIKPNFVHELNFNVSRDGLYMENPNDCFITNYSIIEAVLKFLNQIDDCRILIIEAPIQFCQLEKIVTKNNLEKWKKIVTNGTVEFIDLRRTIMYIENGAATTKTNIRAEENYIDFDLAEKSFFKEKEKWVKRFRVTDYPPSSMKQYHRKGVHRYRIAKEIIDTQWIINIPKLKTHQKAGFTGCMKNFVGVIGNKECLPHHTKGSPLTGGNCHSDVSLLKLCAEQFKDIANGFLNKSLFLYKVNNKIAATFLRLQRCISDNNDLAGSWYGNDTIARTIRDINNIIYYGKDNGVLDEIVQRNVISLVDAITVGEGDGPLRPFPVKRNLLLCGDDTLAVDIVNAAVLGFDYKLIPQTNLNDLLRHERIRISYNGQELPFQTIYKYSTKCVKPAPGWVGHIEVQAK